MRANNASVYNQYLGIADGGMKFACNSSLGVDGRALVPKSVNLAPFSLIKVTAVCDKESTYNPFFGIYIDSHGGVRQTASTLERTVVRDVRDKNGHSKLEFYAGHADYGTSKSNIIITRVEFIV